MKAINVYFEDDEYQKLKKYKEENDYSSWREMFLDIFER